MSDLPEKVREAKEAGKAVYVLEDSENGELFYFYKPGRADMSRFMAKAARQKIAAAVDELVDTTIIYPDAAELTEKVKAQPGLKYALNNALQGELGINREFSVKKL